MLKMLLLKRGIRSDRSLLVRFLKYTGLKDVIVFFDTHAFLKSQYWPQHKLREIQFERIQDTIAHANKKIPFWRDKFSGAGLSPGTSNDWNSFSRIPITRRADFKDKPTAYFTDEDLFAQTHITDATSGSTAEPFKFVQDYDYDLRSFAICRRMFLTASGGKLLPMINIRARIRSGFANKMCWFFPVYNHNQLRYRMETLYRFAQTLKSPFLIYSFSSYVMEMARLCSERHIPFRPAAILTTGEGLQPHEKEFIESRLKAKVYDCYGAMETGWLTFSCEKSVLHINAEFAYVEIVDNDGAPLENGQEGRVIVTTFDNRIMPFIRYDIGDLGTILAEPCACGRTLPLLKIVGRQTDIIKLESDRRVPFLDILGAFTYRPDFVRQYQLIQKSLNEFVVKIIPESAIDDDELADIGNDLRRRLHPGIRIGFEIVEEIPSAASGKKVSFKSLVGSRNVDEHV